MAKKKKEQEQMALIETKEVPQIDVEGIKKEIKGELKTYFEEFNERRLLEELDKSNKRLIKEKNHKIIFRDVIILLLIGFILFAGYVMYRKKVIDFLLNKNTTSEVVKKEEKKEEIKEEKEEKKEEVKETTLDDLIKKYGYLLDNYSLGVNSSYLKDFYAGKLTSEIKKEMTINQLNEKDITNESDYSSIDEDVFKAKFEQLFNDGYNEDSFIYNDNKVRYISKFEQFISDKLLKKDMIISRDIINIKVLDKEIEITTSESADNTKYTLIYVFNNEKLINLKTS